MVENWSSLLEINEHQKQQISGILMDENIITRGGITCRIFPSLDEFPTSIHLVDEFSPRKIVFGNEAVAIANF